MRSRRSRNAAAENRSRGIALIAVLWFLVLLSLVASGFMAVTRGGIREADGVRKRARAEALADSGVDLAILTLLEPAHHETLRTDGSARVVPLDGGRVVLSIQDVAGRIDLNESDGSLLQALFQTAGLPEERAAALAAAVVDWRDADDERSPKGAEAPEYRRAGLPHGPANRPFYAVSELRQVLGMTRALYARVAPSLTVYSGSPDVLPSLAPPPVLAALRRAGLAVDAPEEAFSTGPATPRSAITAGGRAAGGGTTPLPPSETDTYAIRSEADLPGGGRFVREAVVVLTGDSRQPYIVQAWGTPGE